MNNETDNRIDNDPEMIEEIDELAEEQEYEPEEAGEIAPSGRKKRKKKKRRKKHYLLKLFILVILCVAAYFLMHSSVFTVKKIVLEENEHMTQEQMLQITGYKKGINLFEINAGKNEDKLERDAYIKEAKIGRGLPDTIKVKLILRTQTAVIQSDKGFVLIDDEGVVMDILEQAPQYPVLSGLTVKTADKGEPLQVKETQKYEKYMELIEKISDADMYFKTLAIDGKTLTAYATDGLYCTGTIDNVIAGMESGNLQAVFYDLMQKGVTAGKVNVGDDQYYSFGN